MTNIVLICTDHQCKILPIIIVYRSSCVTASVEKAYKISVLIYSFANKIQYIVIILCSKIFSDIFHATNAYENIKIY